MSAAACIDPRTRLIRLIHVAKRELTMDDETYRAMLTGCVKKDSTAGMNVLELEHVLWHMKRCGFRVKTRPPAGRTRTGGAREPRALADFPVARKIRALWLFLYELGAVRNPSEAALAAYVRRIGRVDALQWIDDRAADRLIETMKRWAMRFLPTQVNAMLERLRERLTDMEYVIYFGIAKEALDRGAFNPMRRAWDVLREKLAQLEA
ncbi:MAG: regulatory protein GemA [Candidatus Accumulibacter sp.]|jgi:phage gp16-like protein|nr:regulatory protein GemA [Accumulibacter sp.]